MKGRLKRESCEKLLNAYRKAIEAGQGDIADALEGVIVDEMMDYICVDAPTIAPDEWGPNIASDWPTHKTVRLPKIEPCKTTSTESSPDVTCTITSAEGVFEPTAEMSE